MPSSYKVQTCTLKMSSGYTAKVKNMPWVGSNKGLYIELEFIQVILISELSIVASIGAAFPMLNFQLWQDFESWRRGRLFFTINNAKSTRQTKLLLLFGWRKLAWQHDTWALPWCKAKSMRWWKGGPAVGNTCSLVVGALMRAHWIYSVLLSLSPTEDCLSDSSFLHTGLFPLPLGLICASCLETVQEQSQLRGLVHGTSRSSVPLVLMPVHLRSSVPASFPLRLRVSALCLWLDEMKADWEVMKLGG